MPLRSGPRNWGQSAESVGMPAISAAVSRSERAGARIAGKIPRRVKMVCRMLKKATLAALVILVLAVGARAALRLLTRDGSGIWPMIVSSSPDYDALEAHRARQRESGPPPAPETAPAAGASAASA